MTARLLVLAAFVIVLAGCGGGLDSGNVTAKSEIAAHDETRLFPLVISTGKVTTVILVPWIVHYPDAWRLELRDCLSNAPKCKTGHIYVSEETYRDTRIGAWYAPQRGDLSAAPYKKVRRA